VKIHLEQAVCSCVGVQARLVLPPGSSAPQKLPPSGSEPVHQHTNLTPQIGMGNKGQDIVLKGWNIKHICMKGRGVFGDPESNFFWGWGGGGWGPRPVSTFWTWCPELFRPPPPPLAGMEHLCDMQQ
jgi:hypothetical protein